MSIDDDVGDTSDTGDRHIMNDPTLRGRKLKIPDTGQNLLNSDIDPVRSTYDVALSHYFGLATARIRGWMEEASWYADNSDEVEAAQMKLLKRMAFRVQALFDMQFLPAYFLTDYTTLPSKIGTANLEERSGAKTFDDKARLLREWAFPPDRRDGGLVSLAKTFGRTMSLLYTAETNVFDYFLELSLRKTALAQPYSPKIVRADRFRSSADVWKFMREYGRAPSFIFMGTKAFREVTASGGPSGGLPWSDFRPAITKDGVILVRGTGYFGSLYGTECFTVANRPLYLRTIDDDEWYFVWGKTDEATNVGWYRMEWDVGVFMDHDFVSGLEMKLDVEVGAL